MEVKKNPKLDTFRQAPVYWMGGLVVALLLILTAFEWKSYDAVISAPIEEGMVIQNEEVLEEIPLTVFLPPPPTPVIQEPELEEVPDEKEIKEEVQIQKQEETPVITSTTTVETTQKVVQATAPPEEDPQQIFQIVEENAEYPGGINAFYEYVKKNLKYPSQARRQGIQGRVFLSFVVEKDGSLTDIQVTRGIGGGCDEEAARVLKSSPKWKPGKQRHKPVRVRMSIPIQFTLKN